MGNSESIVAAGMAAAALLCAVWAARLPRGTRKGSTNLVAGLLFGGCFCVVGTWNLIGIHTARHIAVSGTIAGLQGNTAGRSASEFNVVPLVGPAVHVRASYAGPKLADGEDVVVEVLSFHNTLLRLKVIDGRNTGFELTQTTGQGTAAAVLVVGVLMLLGARERWLRSPED